MTYGPIKIAELPMSIEWPVGVSGDLSNQETDLLA
jgi:hypothetical protein